MSALVLSGAVVGASAGLYAWALVLLMTEDTQYALLPKGALAAAVLAASTGAFFGAALGAAL